MKTRKLLKMFLVGAALLGYSAFAEDAKNDAQKSEASQEKKERILVLGNIIPENGTVLTGSSARITQQDIREMNYADINRILRRVPGVYVREEDGYGLFPNIALRGVNSHRATKITLMEDGITTAPAPYSAPDAYYAPNAGRMSGVEVIKGPASIKYGPQTSGGVINYLSTPIPLEDTFYYKQLFGSNNDVRTHMYWGNTYELEAGKLGILLEAYYRENDGFKDIQHSGKETGLTNQFEPMLKLRFEPNSDMYQFFEFKLGYTDMDANETYDGLQQADFNSDPHERYWGTQWDYMDTEAVRTHLRHHIELNDTTTWTNTIYYQRFARNWSKLEGSNDIEVVKGTTAGSLTIKNNNRDYYQYGYLSEVTKEFTLADMDHFLTLGFKYHKDRYQDDSWTEVYGVGGNYDVVSYTENPKSNSPQRMSSEAVSLFLHDEIKITDKLTLSPGVRFEHIRYENRKSHNQQGSDVDIWLPGIGFAYDFNNQWQLFGGVHKGASIPTADDHAQGLATYERSYNYELGLRHFAVDRSYGAEAVVFFNDITDVYDGASIASGSSKGANVGKSQTYGLELSGHYDAGIRNNWSFKNPWYASFTWTKAKLTDVEPGISGGTDGFFAGAKDGATMPYIPEVQFSVGTGIHFKKFGINANVTYVDDAFTTGANTERIDSKMIVDVSAYYQVTENMKLLLSVNNLFDEEYEASHHPRLIRPGAPQSVYAGFEIKF